MTSSLYNAVRYMNHAQTLGQLLCDTNQQTVNCLFHTLLNRSIWCTGVKIPKESRLMLVK
jgi:hypothetical protein